MKVYSHILRVLGFINFTLCLLITACAYLFPNVMDGFVFIFSMSSAFFSSFITTVLFFAFLLTVHIAKIYKDFAGHLWDYDIKILIPLFCFTVHFIYRLILIYGADDSIFISVNGLIFFAAFGLTLNYMTIVETCNYLKLIKKKTRLLTDCVNN